MRLEEVPREPSYQGVLQSSPAIRGQCAECTFVSIGTRCRFVWQCCPSLQHCEVVWIVAERAFVDLPGVIVPPAATLCAVHLPAAAGMFNRDFAFRAGSRGCLDEFDGCQGIRIALMRHGLLCSHEFPTFTA